MVNTDVPMSLWGDETDYTSSKNDRIRRNFYNQNELIQFEFLIQFCSYASIVYPLIVSKSKLSIIHESLG